MVRVMLFLFISPLANPDISLILQTLAALCYLEPNMHGSVQAHSIADRCVIELGCSINLIVMLQA